VTNVNTQPKHFEQFEAFIAVVECEARASDSMETQEAMPRAWMQRTDQHVALCATHTDCARANHSSTRIIERARLRSRASTLARIHPGTASALPGLSRTESSAHYRQYRSAPHRRRQHQPGGGERPRPLQAASLAQNGGLPTRIRREAACELKPLDPIGSKKLQLLRRRPARPPRARARGFC
jgi:hypothetical protein